MVTFVLMRHVQYEFGQILGVYSTRELAEAEQKRAKDWWEYQHDDIEIEEMVIDKLLQVISNEMR
jgi:hypothetical protein